MHGVSVHTVALAVVVVGRRLFIFHATWLAKEASSGSAGPSAAAAGASSEKRARVREPTWLE